jgi:HIRAN domain
MRFSFPRRPGVTAQSEWSLVRLPNGDRVNVVGESHYQPALQRITSRREWVETFYECVAVLVPEPTNPHDPHAVRIEVQGELVGYLSREDAARYVPYLRRLTEQRQLACCEAVIAGRGPGSETANMGVFLHIAAPGPDLVI